MNDEPFINWEKLDPIVRAWDEGVPGTELVLYDALAELGFSHVAYHHLIKQPGQDTCFPCLPPNRCWLITYIEKRDYRSLARDEEEWRRILEMGY